MVKIVSTNTAFWSTWQIANRVLVCAFAVIWFTTNLKF
jgi:hypothetical protein